MHEEPFDQAQGTTETAAQEQKRDHDNTAPGPSTGEAVREVIGAAKQALKAARNDAAKAAQQAVPVATKAAKQGAYDIAYGVAFIASFGVGVISRMTPDTFKTGACEGSVAGKKAAHNLGKRSPFESHATAEEAPSFSGVLDEASP